MGIFGGGKRYVLCMFIFFVGVKRKKYLGCFFGSVRECRGCGGASACALKKRQVKKFYSSILSLFLLEKGENRGHGQKGTESMNKPF
jgi:hypothetical protein